MIGGSSRQRLPVIQQNEIAECGLACLAMVARYHGHDTDLAALRRRFPVSLKGTGLSRLIEIAAALGFDTRPLRAEVTQLQEVSTPCILHWDLNHFVVLAKVWSLLLAPLGLPVAVRINLFAAVTSAAATGLLYLIAHRVLAGLARDPASAGERIFARVGAAAAALLGATAFTVWNQSNVNEKVYTVSLFTIAVLSWLTFRWRDHVGEGKDDNLIIVAIFILALSVGNHLMAFLAAPAMFIFLLMVNARALANWRLYVFGVLAVVLGLSVHLYLPIRAGLDPVINEADPSCPTLGSAITSVLTMGATGCDNLSAALQREQYDKPSVMSDPVAAGFGRDAPRGPDLFAAQIGNYLQYFDWQWTRSVGGLDNWFGGARPVFTLLFVGLGLYGAARHYRADKPSWAYVFTLFVVLSFGLTFYLNFRYGYTYPGDASMEMREEIGRASCRERV